MQIVAQAATQTGSWPLSDRSSRVGVQRPLALSAAVKGAICRIIAALPCRCWPRVSGLVRCLWPGFRDA
jgi:hypothetical protein